MQFSINFEPVNKDVIALKQWSNLNWLDSINKAYRNKVLAVLYNETFEPIGYCGFIDCGTLVKVEVFEIKLGYQRKGVGKIFINKIFEEFRLRNYLACFLNCSEDIMGFWSSLSFNDYKIESDSTVVNMYVELENSLDFNKKEKTFEKIELWDSFNPNQKKAKWVWNLSFINEKRRLSNPIVHPAHFDWRIRWSINDEVKYDGKIKNFKSKKIEIEDFLVIKNI